MTKQPRRSTPRWLGLEFEMVVADQRHAAFKHELEVFRVEQSLAQQYFFAWLQIRYELAENEQLLERVNETPLFWITTQHALLVATFVTLGRIFEKDTRHNVDQLLRIAIDDTGIFSRTALRQRREREGMKPANAAAYVAEKYEPTVDDFVRLRGAVTERRKIYDADFRDIRNKIYAHKELSSRDEMNKLLAKAKIDDLRNLIGFLHALHEALWELLHNGRRPTVCLPYFDPDGVTPLERDAPGEMVARDVISFFRSLTISGQA